MLDMLGAAAFLAVLTALKLGIFEALSDGPMTTTDVARKIEAHQLLKIPL